MKYNLYAKKDVKVGFDMPVLKINDLSALRDFEDECNNEKAFANKHPEDIQLFKLGEMDLETGEIKSEVKFMANAIDYKH